MLQSNKGYTIKKMRRLYETNINFRFANYSGFTRKC